MSTIKDKARIMKIQASSKEFPQVDIALTKVH